MDAQKMQGIDASDKLTSVMTPFLESNPLISSAQVH